MDDVFKALADRTRRQLLDQLFRRDGQSLSELCNKPDMTRFGVMKHLKILEAARLITTRKVGREKLHFLNPVPIRLLHNRWIDKYTEPLTVMLTDLKTKLENANATTKVFEIFIKTTPERLWEAITNPDMRQKYNFGVYVRSTYERGSEYAGTSKTDPDVRIFEGENVDVDAPRRLVQTYRALWSESVKAVGSSRVTWDIEPIGDSCRLTVTHDQLPEDVNPELWGGWPMVISGLKTLLETGELLTTPGSLRWMTPQPE